MAIDVPALLSMRSGPYEYDWSEHKTILYALGVGMGVDPLDRAALRFVYEKELVALPSMAAVMLWGVGPDRARMGIDYRKVVHGEQAITLHRTVPVAGRFAGEARVTGLLDKGPGKGVLISIEQVLSDASGTPIATITSGLFARGDGGCGGSTPRSPEPHVIPDRRPDLVIEMPTRPEQALIYRLSGDTNPLHADPETAASAGFDRPILHGAATFGICCWAVIKGFLKGQPEHLISHAMRFTSPVFPGETILVELWRDGDIVSFRAVAKERSVVVGTNGRAVIASRC